MTERAFLTLSPTLGPGLWLGGRLVARIVATVEDSRVTPDDPEPRWKRDAMTFVNAVNALATTPVPAGLGKWRDRKTPDEPFPMPTVPELDDILRACLPSDVVFAIRPTGDPFTGWARSMLGAAHPVPAGPTLHDMDGHEDCAYDNCEVTRLCPRTSEPQFAPPVPAGDERLREAARMLAYLWDAETVNGTAVRDLFYDDDPLTEDVPRIIAALNETPR